jgi:hypothetical protein
MYQGLRNTTKNDKTRQFQARNAPSGKNGRELAFCKEESEYDHNIIIRYCYITVLKLRLERKLPLEISNYSYYFSSDFQKRITDQTMISPMAPLAPFRRL